MDPLAGPGPLTQVLFGKNIVFAKMKELGPKRGVRQKIAPPRSANEMYKSYYTSWSGIHKNIIVYSTTNDHHNWVTPQECENTQKYSHCCRIEGTPPRTYH